MQCSKAIVLILAAACCAAATNSSTSSLYIFGYGSLFKVASIIKTKCKLGSLSASALNQILELREHVGMNPSTRACVEDAYKRQMILVKAKGVRRGWYSRGGLAIAGVDGVKETDGWASGALDIAPTYLGAVEDANSDCVGVMYEVDQAELDETDKRETMGDYKAAFLNTDPQALEILSKDFQLPLNATVRWYSMTDERIRLPTSRFPIAQSYVDLVIGGAIELGKKDKGQGMDDFAASVAATTSGWSNYWVNDRSVPYRPFANEELAPKITKVLINATKVPNSKLKLSHLEAIAFPSASKFLASSAAWSLPRSGLILHLWMVAMTLPLLLL